MGIFSDFYTQVAFKPPVPTADFSGKTNIVTGANVGLGREASKHFIRLNASKVILTIPSIKKAEAAKAEIEAQTERTGIVEVYRLD